MDLLCPLARIANDQTIQIKCESLRMVTFWGQEQDPRTLSRVEVGNSFSEPPKILEQMLKYHKYSVLHQLHCVNERFYVDYE